MNCQKCQSDRIMRVSGKCSDLFYAQFHGREYDGYVPDDLGIGGGDYVKFHICLECGQIQGEFPKPDPKWAIGMETPDVTDEISIPSPQVEVPCSNCGQMGLSGFGACVVGQIASRCPVCGRNL